MCWEAHIDVDELVYFIQAHILQWVKYAFPYQMVCTTDVINQYS